MKKIVLATNNKNKIKEIQNIISDLDIEILSKGQIGFEDFDVEETEDTLEGNALLKAQALKELIGDEYIVIADDTGLFVEALNGAPGVKSARYAGDQHSDDDNKKKLLEAMLGFEEENRKAKFETVLAIVEDGAEPIFCHGVLNGRIATEERGDSGFGYDPIFIPENHDLTLAQLGLEEKNKISHRRRAIDKLYEILSAGK